jgi:hypothetical protein
MLQYDDLATYPSLSQVASHTTYPYVLHLSRSQSHIKKKTHLVNYRCVILMEEHSLEFRETRSLTRLGLPQGSVSHKACMGNAGLRLAENPGLSDRQPDRGPDLCGLSCASAPPACG